MRCVTRTKHKVAASDPPKFKYISNKFGRPCASEPLNRRQCLTATGLPTICNQFYIRKYKRIFWRGPNSLSPALLLILSSELGTNFLNLVAITHYTLTLVRKFSRRNRVANVTDALLNNGQRNDEGDQAGSSAGRRPDVLCQSTKFVENRRPTMKFLTLYVSSKRLKNLWAIDRPI